MLRYIAEAFIGSKEEDEYGIVENQSMGLQQWENSMSVFDRCELYFDLIPDRDAIALRANLVRLGLSEERAQRTASTLFGAVISGLCRVEDGADPAKPDEFLQAFVCPDCSQPLSFDGAFMCPACGPFEMRGNVHMLLPRAQGRRLYGQAHSV